VSFVFFFFPPRPSTPETRTLKLTEDKGISLEI